MFTFLRSYFCWILCKLPSPDWSECTVKLLVSYDQDEYTKLESWREKIRCNKYLDYFLICEFPTDIFLTVPMQKSVHWSLSVYFILLSISTRQWVRCRLPISVLTLMFCPLCCLYIIEQSAVCIVLLTVQIISVLIV